MSGYGIIMSIRKFSYSENVFSVGLDENFICFLCIVHRLFHFGYCEAAVYSVVFHYVFERISMPNKWIYTSFDDGYKLQKLIVGQGKTIFCFKSIGFVLFPMLDGYAVEWQNINRAIISRSMTAY